MAALKIGALAERTGTNPPTIRYYEEIGLVKPAGRASGGQRTYGDEDVKLLTFIRRCRDRVFQSSKCARSWHSHTIGAAPARRHAISLRSIWKRSGQSLRS